MPVWYPADDRSRGEEIIRFAERTSASGIEVVGILDNPLAEGWDLRDPNQPSDVADLLLTDPSFWENGLDLVAGQIEAAQEAAEEVIAAR